MTDEFFMVLLRQSSADSFSRAAQMSLTRMRAARSVPEEPSRLSRFSARPPEDIFHRAALISIARMRAERQTKKPEESPWDRVHERTRGGPQMTREEAEAWKIFFESNRHGDISMWEWLAAHRAAERERRERCQQRERGRGGYER